MKNTGAISNFAAPGVIGANDTNQLPASRGDDAPALALACRSWYVSYIVRLW